MATKDDIVRVMGEELKRQHGETLSVLDTLRRSRKARGGVGAPLIVPAHLREAAQGMGIIITDAALDPRAPVPTKEELNDTEADMARTLGELESEEK